MPTVSVKILGYKKSQRYPIWRTLQAALQTLEKELPGVQLEIQEVRSTDEILRYAPVIAFPSLMIAERLVCVGRSPKQAEVLDWLKTAIQQPAEPTRT